MNDIEDYKVLSDNIKIELFIKALCKKRQNTKKSKIRYGFFSAHRVCLPGGRRGFRHAYKRYCQGTDGKRVQRSFYRKRKDE